MAFERFYMLKNLLYNIFKYYLFLDQNGYTDDTTNPPFPTFEPQYPRKHPNTTFSSYKDENRVFEIKMNLISC